MKSNYLAGLAEKEKNATEMLCQQCKASIWDYENADNEYEINKIAQLITGNFDQISAIAILKMPHNYEAKRSKISLKARNVCYTFVSM